MSSCVKELKLITPQGKQMTVTERNRGPDAGAALELRLLGVVHEVVLRVRPLTPVKIDYQVLTLKEFAARFSAHRRRPGRIAPAHLALQRSHHGGAAHPRRGGGASSRSGIWQIRKSVMRNVLPAFGSTVGSVLAAPGVRGAVVSGVQRALRATLDRAARGVVMHAHEWMRDCRRKRGRSRYTYSCGVSAGRFSEAARRVFRVLQGLLQAARYRCNVVNGASRLHQDRRSLFSVSYSRARCSRSSPPRRATRAGTTF
jgi:hypothetical protein